MNQVTWTSIHDPEDIPCTSVMLGWGEQGSAHPAWRGFPGTLQLGSPAQGQGCSSWHQTDLGFTSHWPSRFRRLGLSHSVFILKMGKSLLIPQGLRRLQQISDKPTNRVSVWQILICLTKERMDMARKTQLETLQHGVALRTWLHAHCLHFPAGLLTQLAMVGGAQSQGPGCQALRGSGPSFIPCSLCDHWQIPSSHHASVCSSVKWA